MREGENTQGFCMRKRQRSLSTQQLAYKKVQCYSLVIEEIEI